jgi:DNA-binding GntR family transcriptional regulator
MTQHDGPRFPPRGRRLVYMGVADEITKRIEDGTYPPDGRLPAEHEFMAEFGCSRESVRRAMEKLREKGWIETVRGKGSYVVPAEERTPQT